MPGMSVTRSTWMTLARAFLIAVLMALAMMLMAFGFVNLMARNESLPVSAAIILLVFALSFVASVVLLQRTGTGQTTSILGGAAVAVGFTLCIVTLCSGVLFLQNNTEPLETDMLVGGFALSLVASVIINQLTLKI